VVRDCEEVVNQLRRLLFAVILSLADLLADHEVTEVKSADREVDQQLILLLMKQACKIMLRDLVFLEPREVQEEYFRTLVDLNFLLREHMVHALRAIPFVAFLKRFGLLQEYETLLDGAGLTTIFLV